MWCFTLLICVDSEAKSKKSFESWFESGSTQSPCYCPGKLYETQKHPKCSFQVFMSRRGPNEVDNYLVLIINMQKIVGAIYHLIRDTFQTCFYGTSETILYTIKGGRTLTPPPARSDVTVSRVFISDAEMKVH